jgi:hypothetical protein
MHHIVDTDKQAQGDVEDRSGRSGILIVPARPF